MKKVKKKYEGPVLCVVHTSGSNRDKNILRRVFMAATTGKLSEKQKESYKKYPKKFKKAPVGLYYKGVFEAMKIAQEKGVPIIYQPSLGEAPFLKALKKHGIDKKSIIKLPVIWEGGHTALKAKEKLEKRGIVPKEFIVLGHFRDVCVRDFMMGLKTKGVYPESKVSMLVGTSSPVSDAKGLRKRLEKEIKEGEFGKITMANLRKIRKRRRKS